MSSDLLVYRKVTGFKQHDWTIPEYATDKLIITFISWNHSFAVEYQWSFIHKNSI